MKDTIGRLYIYIINTSGPQEFIYQVPRYHISRVWGTMWSGLGVAWVRRYKWPGAQLAPANPSLKLHHFYTTNTSRGELYLLITDPGFMYKKFKENHVVSVDQNTRRPD